MGSTDPTSGRPPATAPLEGSPEPPLLAGRYRYLCDIERGGMGSVLRVMDLKLHVPVALKVLHPHLAVQPAWKERFEEEARLLAALRHPGIPAVHDLDRLESGTPFYTMEEVEGVQLGSLFAQLPLRRRIDLVLRASVIIAHAHMLGVVHRDLSAANVLATDLGEVRVVDWGLARQAGDDRTLPGPLEGPTRRVGTPGYAPPEQQSGALPHPRMDVFALGGLLGYALTLVPPHEELPAIEEPELRRLYEACRSSDVAARPAHAGEVAQALRDWSDGLARRDRSRTATLEASRHAQQAAALDLQAEQLRREGAERLSGVPPHAPEEDKAPGWVLEDRAAQIEGEAERERVLSEQKLLLAIREDPSQDEPHERLARRWMEQLAGAERTGDRRGGVRYATLVRSWRDGRYSAWVDAPAALLLDTEPSGAEVVCERFVERNRRLVPEVVGVLGQTPLSCALEPGSYRLRLRAPEHHEVLLPVVLERGSTWTYQNLDRKPRPLWLPPQGSLGPDDCYVPAGWFWRGGDPFATDGLPRQEVYVHGFVMSRYPVTVGQYVSYLDGLVRDGLLEEALARVPREADGVPTGSRPVFVLGADRSFQVAGDVWHQRWSVDWPVTLVDWGDAWAYAEHAGWRLPHDHEWEKAARGADERLYAWGNFFDSTWANMVVTRATSPEQSPVEAFPIDVSPYGIRGLTGNVRDWCSNGYTRAGPSTSVIDPREDPSGSEYRMVRGGSWSSTAMMCRLATRLVSPPGGRLTGLGFRLARSLGP